MCVKLQCAYWVHMVQCADFLIEPSLSDTYLRNSDSTPFSADDLALLSLHLKVSSTHIRVHIVGKTETNIVRYIPRHW